LKNFVLYHLPAILYAALVVTLSSIPYLGQKHPEIFGLDKIIHFIEYALFAVLIFRSFSHISEKLKMRLVVLLSFLFVILFAVFDEYYQSHIPGRQPDMYDLIFDIFGALIILLIMGFWRIHKSNA